MLLHAVVVTQASIHPCDSGLIQQHVHEQATHHAAHGAIIIVILLFDDGHGEWVLQHGLNDTQSAIAEKGQWIDSNQKCPTHCL